MSENDRTDVPQEKAGLERLKHYKENHDKAEVILKDLAEMPVAFWKAYQAGLIDWRNGCNVKTWELVITEIMRCTTTSKTIQGLRAQGYQCGWAGLDANDTQKHYQRCIEYYTRKFGAVQN